jgi:hypothetical protein
MMPIVNFLLDRANAVLIVFVAVATMSGIVAKTPTARAAAGIGGLIVALFITISNRSLFEWLVSAVERPSAPGLLLLIVFAISSTSGRNYLRAAEFRFGTAVIIFGGVLLYPGAVGFLNYDTYVLGYSGYLLPMLLAAILVYAIYRRFFLVALALNLGILGFLLSAGRSLNLWDYVIDPVAWFLAIGAWLAIAPIIFVRKPAAAPSLVS